MKLKSRNRFYILIFLNIVFVLIAARGNNPVQLSDLFQLERIRNQFEMNQLLAYFKSEELLSPLKQMIIWSSVYIPIYILFSIALLLRISYKTKHIILAKAGQFFSILIFVAGFCDVFAKISLFHIMNYGINQWNLYMSYDMNATKYSILFVVFLFLLTCCVYILIQKLIPEKEKTYFNSKP